MGRRTRRGRRWERGRRGRGGAAVRCTTPPLTFAYSSYWSGVPIEGIETAHRAEQRRVLIAFPTNDGLTTEAVQGAIADFRAFRGDLEGAFFAALALAPDLHERVRAGRRAERWRGSGDLPNFVRAAHGPGWALLGDAAALAEALHGNQPDTDRYYGVEFGTIPRQEFYAPDNIARIIGAAPTAVG